MKVAIIGQGYVGLNLAIGAASVGHEVVGLDSNENLINDLKIGKTLIPGIEKGSINHLINKGKYFPTTNIGSIDGNEIIVIAVPTPLDSFRKPDLSYLENAALNIANLVTKRALIVNESTSYPGTLRNFIKPIIESRSNIDFEYASAPERIDPASNEWNLQNTPRIVSGLSTTSTKLALKFYQTFCNNVHEVSQPEVAEAAKIFENTFRQINIALANEFSIIANAIGFSANEAIKAASTKPFGFMPFYPSIGVGGHCIPIDPTYLSHAALQVGVNAQFIELANETNLSMTQFVVSKLCSEFGGSLDGIKIQLVGISYKQEVPDMRESPAMRLIKSLREVGAIVSWHDPIVVDYQGESSAPISDQIDLGLILNPHKQINYSLWEKSNTRVLDLSPNSLELGWPKFF